MKCSNLGLPHIRFESDCAQLIKALHSESSFVILYETVADIISTASFFETISFSSILRERNIVADGLAKHGLSVCLNDKPLPQDIIVDHKHLQNRT